jgi:hypothetical protein
MPGTVVTPAAAAGAEAEAPGALAGAAAFCALTAAAPSTAAVSKTPQPIAFFAPTFLAPNFISFISSFSSQRAPVIARIAVTEAATI